MKKYLLLIHIFFLSTVAFTQENNQLKEPITPALHHRLSPAITKSLKDSAVAERRIYTITVSDTAAFELFLHENRNTIQVKGYWKETSLYLIATSTRIFYKHIMPLPYLVFADARTTRPHTELAISDFNHTYNTINTTHAMFPSVTGEGITVSVKENLFDTTDIDIRHRIKPTAIASNTTATHASTMATLIGGAGNTYYTGRGVAKAVTLSSSSFDVLLPDTNAYSLYGISVQNHSYGVDIENYYGSDAAAYDASMIKDTALVHVFSTGNIGTDKAVGGRYDGIPGYSNLTGSFKMAKNIITVGAIDSLYNVSALSSRGPAYDGRVKPELVAYGQNGSSEAAALVSGAAVLLQHAYRQQHSNALPASALVKAMLVNSASDVLQKGPDFTSGYGVANVYKAMQALVNGQWMQGSIQQGQTVTLPLTIPGNSSSAKITLVWNDVAATPNAATALVNDVDLELYQPATNTVWQPWVLNTAASIDSLQLPAVRGRDSINTLEQVTLDNPPAGSWQIRVKGRTVKGIQPFYIAYQFDTAETFTWLAPRHTDNCIPASTNILKWEYHGAQTTGQLDISYDKGVHWQVLEAQVPLQAPYYKWYAPDTFTTALARLTIAGTRYLSDTFSISYQQYPAVGFNCTDSLMLYWPSLPGAVSYQLYQLKDKYLELLQGHITDTSLVVYLPDAAYAYYAVAPVNGDGQPGGISYSINYQQQGVACYFYGLLADYQGDNTGLITAQLGSLYNVKAISIEKQVGNGWKVLKSYTVSDDKIYTITDSSLVSGPNNYRATLTTTSGSYITSEVASLYYWKEDEYIVYPNPVRTGQLLQLLSQDPFNKVASLYSINGAKVWQQTIANTLEQLPVAHLPAGVYVLVIYNSEGKMLTTKKIVIQ
ncbi:Por secretion system C-terminal sorting domain-containing protein [Filimonas lacunae]|uniref:Por secretion system C-terminal sorting domain-containing protein n=1 Tax=Filimonas lacunae TaxID=477680 RepID=A0A173MFD5_9BACT|nr:S8 family peptidase [Filimonas lacunae]BAV06322.1 hypothetical protein FLA_2338 [Filimonas lacunae]SIT25804.1 Por secretion system C-terminal sorting domain-containing protein [Filimonas lacunae]